MIPNILAISGSTRPGSVNEQIIKWLAVTYRNQANINLYDQLARLDKECIGLDRIHHAVFRKADRPDRSFLEWRKGIRGPAVDHDDPGCANT
jgi:hypothetical protein